MPSALDLAEDNLILIDAVRRSRKLLNRRALVGAVAGTIPVPGLDWAVDAALLSRLVPAARRLARAQTRPGAKGPRHGRLRPDRQVRHA
jgi:hypothetical protein